MTLFLLGALATYGLAWSIATLHGPFGLFMEFRNFAGTTRFAWLHEGAQCPICLSFWLGVPVSLLAVGLIPHAALHWLGYVGFAVFANVVLNRLRAK